jgi:light-regulated signal transduction histidine kinase (bacteriophytochrome)/two-component sensor histidine kinase
MSEHAIHFGSVDLTNCDREPIHIPGSVQPHGALLAFDPRDMCVLQAGGDSAGLLGAPVMALLGMRAAEVLLPAHQERLQILLDARRSLVRPVFAFTIEHDDGRITDAFVHMSGGLLLLELEPRGLPIVDDAMALVQRMVRDVQRAGSLQACLETIASEVRRETGFDRVMVYRFAPDGSGAVVAEARDDAMGSFFGLHFPATDIPAQARELYLKNWIRYIPDARYAPLPIVPPLNPLNGQPLDLSHSVLRSVSPMRRQYLSNMGVAGSMSLSLVVRGQLWGLIACHHNAPCYLTHRLRDACALFAEMVSSHLEMKLTEIDLEAQLHATRIHEALVARMSQEADLSAGLIKFRPNLLDLILAGGVGLWVEGRFNAIGTTPGFVQVEALVDWLNATGKEGIFHTDCLSSVYPPAQDFPAIASGLLALCVSKSSRDYVLWFRPEISRLVVWAGNPNKQMEVLPDGPHLTPRNSFASWQQAVRMHAHPWSTVELDAAHRLRLSLLEIVLRRIEQTAREREAVRRQQEKLAAELDKRLEELQTTAKALKRETERRAVLEAELSQVLRRTVADQEAERLRIARELHDTLGQSLTLLQLGLEGLGAAGAANTDFDQRLTALKGLTAEFGRDLNRLAWEIRPTALDDLGIQIAIRNLLETWSDRCGIAFDLHMGLTDERLSPEVQTTLYRVLQEALTNVVRHADATRVGVVLGATDRLITMIIEDDGRGFSRHPGLNNLPPNRLGLLGIRERLALVGGSLEVESLAGSGTTLFVRIPVTSA